MSSSSDPQTSQNQSSQSGPNNQTSQGNTNNQGENPHQDFIEAVEWSNRHRSGNPNIGKSEGSKRDKEEGGINWIYVAIAVFFLVIVFFALNYFYKKPVAVPPNMVVNAKTEGTGKDGLPLVTPDGQLQPGTA